MDHPPHSQFSMKKDFESPEFFDSNRVDTRLYRTHPNLDPEHFRGNSKYCFYLRALKAYQRTILPHEVQLTTDVRVLRDVAQRFCQETQVKPETYSIILNKDASVQAVSVFSQYGFQLPNYQEWLNVHPNYQSRLPKIP